MKTIALLVVIAFAGIYQCSAQISAKIPLTVTGNADGSVKITLGTASGILSADDSNAVKGIATYVKNVISDATVGNTQTYKIPVTLNSNGTANVNLKGKDYTVSPATLSAILQQLQQALAPFSG